MKDALQNVRGLYICRKCGTKELQTTYDCNVYIVCRECDPEQQMSKDFRRLKRMEDQT